MECNAMETLTANELKIKGVSAINNDLLKNQEIVVSVHGKNKYILMDMDRYNYLRECELTAAVAESLKEYQSGDYISESVDDHIRRIKDEL
jgi:hypothetical protein